MGGLTVASSLSPKAFGDESDDGTGSDDADADDDALTLLSLVIKKESSFEMRVVILIGRELV